MTLNRSFLALLAGLALSTGLPEAATVSLMGISPAYADDIVVSDNGGTVGDTGATSDEESDGVVDVSDGDGAVSNDTCTDNTNETIVASRC